LLGQSKFEGSTLCRDVNEESVDTVLGTVAHENFPIDDVFTGFKFVTLGDTTSVIRNQ